MSLGPAEVDPQLRDRVTARAVIGSPKPPVTKVGRQNAVGSPFPAAAPTRYTSRESATSRATAKHPYALSPCGSITSRQRYVPTVTSAAVRRAVLR